MLLGVNIDHVATLRNARGGIDPDPITAARICKECGVASITTHLREDRRHIKDADVEAIRMLPRVRLNLEMAMTKEMQEIALRLRPHAVCIVPEKRQELTTEGGLDVAGQLNWAIEFTKPLLEKNIEVSFFIDPDVHQISAVSKTGAPFIELHTGRYSEVFGTEEEAKAFEDLIENINAKYIVLSYNNMAEKGNDRSNAKISDEDIYRILGKKGKVKTFEQEYKAFSTGKSNIEENAERLFICQCY